MRPLTQLNQAIDQRIQREHDFIQVLIKEFETCAKQIEKVARGASTEVEDSLRPIVSELNEATKKLKTLTLPEDDHTRSGEAIEPGNHDTDESYFDKVWIFPNILL